MSTLVVIACGSVKEPYLKKGIAEFTKRLSRYTKVSVLEVPDGPDSINISIQLEREAAGILQKIPAKGYVIALDIKGKTVDSEMFSAILEDGFAAGGARLVFIIGGSRGLGPSVLKRADLCLSFSAMTFPHQLMRLILLEQCYRAFRILRGEPYHK